jgi:hypothetical protein
MAFPILLALNLAMLLPSVVQAIVTAEQIFSGRRLGNLKKEFVMSSLQVFVTGMMAVSTGGQLATWQSISKNWPMLGAGIGDFVDFLCKVLFTKEESENGRSDGI